MIEAHAEQTSQAQALKSHIYVVHEKHRDHECDTCGKSFGRAGDLKEHIETVHNELSQAGLKEFKCEKCGKSYSAEKNLKSGNYIPISNFLFYLSSVLFHQRQNKALSLFSLEFCSTTAKFY